MGCSSSRQNDDVNDIQKSQNIIKNDMIIVFVIGGPGSGKGTQCGKLKEFYGFKHLSSGDLLRNEVQNGGELGLKINQIQQQGGLVDSKIVVEVLLKELNKKEKGVYLIDGFPRNKENLDEWEKQRQGEFEASWMLFFDTSDEVMKSRITERSKSSGRADDNPESVQNRIQTYHNETIPIITFYQSQSKLITFNADGEIEDIFADVRFKVAQKGLDTFQHQCNLKLSSTNN